MQGKAEALEKWRSFRGLSLALFLRSFKRMKQIRSRLQAFTLFALLLVGVIGCGSAENFGLVGDPTGAPQGSLVDISPVIPPGEEESESGGEEGSLPKPVPMPEVGDGYLITCPSPKGEGSAFQEILQISDGKVAVLDAKFVEAPQNAMGSGAIGQSNVGPSAVISYDDAVIGGQDFQTLANSFLCRTTYY